MSGSFAAAAAAVVPVPAEVAALAAAGTHTCALILDQPIRCWGEEGGDPGGEGITIPIAALQAVTGVRP